MSAPLEIVCEIYGVDVSHAQQQRVEKALGAIAEDVFGKPVRGLWVHEGVFGPRHPRYVVCPTCESPPGVPCRNLSVTARFTTLAGGRYHRKRHELSGNR